LTIEFRCPTCGKLLRVGDDAAGRQAKCPACATVQQIPNPSAAANPPSGGQPPPPAPESLWQEPLPPPPGFANNPYASPGSAGMPFADAPATGGPRLGPPWERDGASFGSFCATVKEFFLSPIEFFSQLRRTAGVMPPLNFAAAGSIIGCLAAMTYFTALSLLQPNGPLAQVPAAGPERVGYFVGMTFTYGCCSIVVLPLMMLVYTLGAAGLLHLTLLILGAAKFPYQTTLRVVAYSVGGSILISVLPLCGFRLSFPVQLAYIGIGVARAQETSAGIAVAAVLLPALLCGGAVGALIVFAAVAG
jgi:phage FluMu protein Com